MFKWISKKSSTGQQNYTENQKSLETDFAVNFVYHDEMRSFETSEILQKYNLQRYRLKYLEEDVEISRCIDIRLARILQKDWHIESDNKTLSKWLTQQIEKHYRDIITTAWRSCLYGYSVFEIDYQLIDNKIEIKKCSEKPFEWFYPTHNGDLMYIGPNQANPLKIVDDEILKYKFVMSRNQSTYENPYGKSTLINCYLPQFFKAKNKQLWLQWLERFAQPFIVGKTQAVNVSKFLQALNKIARGSAISISKEDEITTLDANNSAGQHFKEMYDVSNLEIQRVLLGQEMAGERGNAMGNHGFMLADKVADHIEQHDVIRCFSAIQQVIDLLLEINSISINAKIIADVDTDLNIERTNRDSTLIQSGIISSFTDKYLQNNYGLESDDYVLGNGLNTQSNVQNNVEAPPSQFKFSDTKKEGIKLPPNEIKKAIDSQKIIDEISSQSSENIKSIFTTDELLKANSQEELEDYLFNSENDSEFLTKVFNTMVNCEMKGTER